MSVNNFLPQQVVVGSSFRITDDVKATFDATWIDWSAYVAPVAQLDVALDIPPPAGGWPATIQPPQAPAPTRIQPIVMRDRVVPRLGGEWRFLDRERVDAFLRGGYELALSPIAAQAGTTNYVDRDRHSMSVGVGTTLRDVATVLPGALSIDAHFQWSELVSATTLKASAADLVGDYTAGGRIFNFGITTSFAFDPPKPEAK